ncbi:MAG: hypothetical protein MUF42_00330 [Cytophagaceae bacterium]|jgi:hypothetical protein|nr:hypothetical protein [Cytophagaceae bacterium]
MKIGRNWILAVTFVGLLSACSDVERLGPDQKAIFSKVVVKEGLTATTSNPNFSTGQKVGFKAVFERDAYWVLTITGNNSGAKYTVEGISNEIDPSKIVWDGRASSLPAFALEPVTAKVSFPNSPGDTLRLNMTVAGRRNMDAGAVIVTNFSAPKIAWQKDWPPIEYPGTTTNYGFPDGNNYCYMSGTPWQGAGSPYVNFLNIRAVNSDVSYTSGFFPLYADYNKVYFNIMVYGNGPSNKTWLQIGLQENGVAARNYNIRPNWTGWKLVTIKYTDFVPDNEEISYNPQKINLVSLVLLSDAVPLATTPVSVAVDHMVFTHGGPLQP